MANELLPIQEIFNRISTELDELGVSIYDIKLMLEQASPLANKVAIENLAEQISELNVRLSDLENHFVIRTYETGSGQITIPSDFEGEFKTTIVKENNGNGINYIVSFFVNGVDGDIFYQSISNKKSSSFDICIFSNIAQSTLNLKGKILEYKVYEEKTIQYGNPTIGLKFYSTKIFNATRITNGGCNLVIVNNAPFNSDFVSVALAENAAGTLDSTTINNRMISQWQNGYKYLIQAVNGNTSPGFNMDSSAFSCTECSNEDAVHFVKSGQITFSGLPFGSLGAFSTYIQIPATSKAVIIQLSLAPDPQWDNAKQIGTSCISINTTTLRNNAHKSEIGVTFHNPSVINIPSTQDTTFDYVIFY